MLTIIAWFVFIQMSIWNVVIWSIGFAAWIDKTPVDKKRSIVNLVVSMMLWIIPGVYLFGWF